MSRVPPPAPQLDPSRSGESFVGEAIVPEGVTFSADAMARGEPGLPRAFQWNGRPLHVQEVLETWKETGACRHGSGERYVRKHWFRVRTHDGLELRLYFERQARSPGGSRWRLFTIKGAIQRALREDAIPSTSLSPTVGNRDSKKE